MEDKNKKIDESWKETVEREKKQAQQAQDKEQATTSIPEVNFSFFISTLALQASIFLGDIPNPADNKTQVNLEQAKFIIDTIGMLKEKTKNNLQKDESELLDHILYDLRMRFVARKEGHNDR